MSDSSLHSTHSQTRILRYTAAIAVAVLLATWINWPLAFVAPVLVAKFLVDKPCFSRATLYELLIAMTVTMGLGLLLTGGITHYPIPLLLLVGLAMLWAYYLFSDPKWNLFATMLMMAVLMLPFMAIATPGVSIMLAAGLAASGLAAIIIFSVAHIYFPEPKPAVDNTPALKLNSTQRWAAAFRAMLISFPVVSYFYIYQISDALMVMIFIALLSLMITAQKSIKISAFLLICNTLGGLLAILCFYILSLAPSILFYTAMLSLLAIIIATQIYTKPTKAPIYASAFSTVLVLLGSSLLSPSDIDQKMLARLSQIALIAIYMVLCSLFLETRDWAFLNNINRETG